MNSYVTFTGLNKQNKQTSENNNKIDFKMIS